MTDVFTIDRDYIQSLIPDNIRDTWTFERVADIIYSVINDDIANLGTVSGKSIKNYYNDIVYYNTDTSKLSAEMLACKLSDYGFSYIAELYEDIESLRGIISMLPLIKYLKGSIEGFKLILQLLGISCDVISWTEDNSLQIFTINLLFKISGTETILYRDENKDKTVSETKYFAWSDTDDVTYYTKNPTNDIYKLNKTVLTLQGNNFPNFSESSGELKDSSFSGYYYTNFDISDDFTLTLTTDTLTTDTQELLRALSAAGDVLFTINLQNDTISINSESLVTIEANKQYSISLEVTENESDYTYIVTIGEQAKTVDSSLKLASLDICRNYSGLVDLYNSANGDARLALKEDIAAGSPYISIDTPTIIYTITNNTVTPTGVTIDSSLNTLDVSVNQSNDTINKNNLDKIRKIARNYLAPMVTVNTVAVQEVARGYNHYSCGLIKNKTYATLEVKKKFG